MDYSDILVGMMVSSIKAKKNFIEDDANLRNFQTTVSALVDAYKDDGRLYIAGNGGSAADAQHMAAEFVSKLMTPRRPLPAEALTVDTSILTAVGNDYGFENIFSRQIEAKMTAKDILLAITTSGKSPNIINALETCKDRAIKTIVLTGKDESGLREISDYIISVNSNKTTTIQEVHSVILHSICAAVETSLL